MIDGTGWSNSTVYSIFSYRSSEESSSESDTGSRSRSPDDGKIEFITSFGGDDEEPKKPSAVDSEKSLSKSLDSRSVFILFFFPSILIFQ